MGIKVLNRCSESSFFRILWCHLNLIVHVESIHKQKHGISYGRIYQQVHVEQWELVFRANPIKISEIDTALCLPVFLFHGYNVGQPPWVLDRLDETSH